MNVPTIDIVQTGANIKALRKAAGIKVKDVADTLGVSTQAVAKWQAGTALPTSISRSHFELAVAKFMSEYEQKEGKIENFWSAEFEDED